MKNRQEVFAEVRAILLRDWDPLCVGDNPNLADEYDRYLPRIVDVLETGVTALEMAAFLQELEYDAFRSSEPASEECALAASALVALRSSLNRA